MKILLRVLLITIMSSQAFAQNRGNLRDDLAKDKAKSLSKFLPMYNGVYLHKVYVMPIPEIQKSLDAFRHSMEPEIAVQQTALLRDLARKDVDYYAKNAMNYIVGIYGMDSIGQINLQNIRLLSRKDTNALALEEEAFKKAFVKSIPRSQRDSIFNSIYAHPELDNEELYKRSAAYRDWLGNYINRLRMVKYRNDTAKTYVPSTVKNLRIVNAEIPSGFVSNELKYIYTSELLKMVKDSATKEAAFKDFMSSSKNIEQRKELEVIYANFKSMTGNTVSADFDYESITGKPVSLKSLRGKYVYIDVWATWCGPCKAEIPFLQKIEEEFHGRNINFVSLSVDRIADKAKWSKYVKENKLDGIQVIADKDFNSDFIKKYNIIAIPRFILIDPNGTIISADAARPSDPKLKMELNRLLSNKG